MTAVFRLLGVDYVQWKAVTRTLLRTDFRVPMSGRASAFGRLGDLLTLVVVFGMFGAGAALVVFMNGDVLLTGTLALTYLSVMLATSLLSQHGTTLLSTVDYVILGSRPVSSRTFLAIRVTNVLFHALMVTTLMAYPVVIAYVVAHGTDGVRGAAAAAAIYAWAIALTLTLVASYGALLRMAGAARLLRALAYLQLLVGFLAYGGIFLISRSFAGPALSGATMPDSPWLVLVPPAWYASYLELAVGAVNSTTWVRAGLSIGAIVALVATLGGKLGLEYAGRLAELPATAGMGGSKVVATPFFAHGEARAAAIIVLAHFRHDLRVRMGILAVVPLIVFYTLLGTSEPAFDLVALGVLLFPALLSQHFAASDAYKASWIYGSTPADRGRLVIAVKNVAVVYFLVPFLLLVAAVFAWRFRDVSHAIVHTAMLGLSSHIALQAAVIISPRLPFALPPDKTRGSASLFAWMLVVILGGQAALIVLDRWVYPAPGRTATVLMLLLAASWMLNRVIALRARSIPN